MRVFIEFMPSLGDLVTQLPILHALHEQVRPLDVEVSVLQSCVGLLEDYDWIGRRHVRTDRWGSRFGPLASSYHERFDLLLYLRSNPAIKTTRLLVSARRKVGTEVYDEPGHRVVPHRFSILRHVLAEPLPAISTRIALGPQRTPDALAVAGLAPGARFVCLGPGASVAHRRWPVQRFAELALALRDLFDGVVVLGSPGEAELCGQVAERAGGVSLAGQPLSLVAALMPSSALYVGNDSGLSHLAAAQGCPAVSIGLVDPYYTPWNGYGIAGQLSDLSAQDVMAFLTENGLVSAASGRGIVSGSGRGDRRSGAP